MKHRTIHWFRKGLRLHDNPALLHAVTSSDVVYPVFIFDKVFLKTHDNIGTKRMRFIFDCITELQKDLQNLGSNLYIFCGDTATILKSKVKEWNISQLTFIVDTELFYKDRDREIVNSLRDMGAVTVSKIGHTLYDIDSILEANDGLAPLTFRKFLSVVSKLGDPPQPVETVTEAHFKKCSTPQLQDQPSRCPTLKEMGLKDDVDTMLWRGGETTGLERMKKRLNDEGWMAPGSSNKSTVNNNALLPLTTGLSPYFSCGCLSSRLFFHAIRNVKAEARKHCFTPSSLQGQLLWRDFFYTVAAYTPNFTVMRGNPICLQIEWATNAEHLKRWTEGQTGYPWIDAIMRQLQNEGWIHHLARHAVACFLTRGDLWISWEEGQKVFEQTLIDSDYSMNAGNWMWLSASAFSHHYTKIFHPVKFGKRTDSTGEYVRRYIKELKDFPAKYIYEPWTAPIEIQKEAKCIIGIDYPLPVVDHVEASEANLKRLMDFRTKQAETVKLTTDELPPDSSSEGPGFVGVKRAYDVMEE